MANIVIKLNKNFTTQLNRLQEKYGEDFARLNGLSDTQLNFTEFIDNFIDTTTVADASIDGNANVGHKDIVTMLNEMPKAHQKLLALNKLYYEMNKKYDVAGTYRMLWNEDHTDIQQGERKECGVRHDVCRYPQDGRRLRHLHGPPDGLLLQRGGCN